IGPTSPDAICLALQPGAVVMEKAEAADDREHARYGNDDRRTPRERLESPSEHVPAEAEGRRPRGGAQAAEEQEAPPRPPVDSREKSGQRTQKRHKARDEHEAAAVPIEQIAAKPEIAFVEVKIA